MNLDLINNIVLYLPVGAGLLMFGWIFAQSFHEKLTAGALKKITLFFALFLTALIAVKILLQYAVLRSDQFGKLTLPPYQSWYWFLYSMWAKNVAPFLFAFAGGALMCAAAIFTNTRFKRELFVEHDPYILVLAALAVGWPNFVMFLVLAAILTVAQSAVISSVKKDFSRRIIITNVLLASAVLVLIFGNSVGKYFKIWMLTI